jgi:hypothetical protein
MGCLQMGLEGSLVIVYLVEEDTARDIARPADVEMTAALLVAQRGCGILGHQSHEDGEPRRIDVELDGDDVTLHLPFPVFGWLSKSQIGALICVMRLLRSAAQNADIGERVGLIAVPGHR